MYDRATLLIGYLFLAGSSFASSELVFLSEPAPSQAVLEGRPATLECRAPPNLRVHWELKGEPLDISSRRYMVGTDLFIVKALHDQDRGPFTCVITDTDTGESLSSRPAFLDITWVDEVVKVKTVGKVPTVSGGDLHLTCVVEGSEPLQIQWFKNVYGLKTSGKINTTGYDLVVTGVNPLDNGVYRCVASNAAATVTSYNRVSVTIPGEQWAQMVLVPEDVVAKQGTNSKFDCVYQFADVIEWYHKQTGPLENSTKYNIFPNGSLVVLDVKESDEGQYSCVGIRGESTEVPQLYSASLRLSYLEEPDNRTLVPLTDGNLRLINEGGDLEVGCNAPTGLPKPAVSWSRGSKGQILSLRGVTKADAGNYTCIISNLADTKYVSFELAITVEPEITQHPIDTMVDEGVDALFHCEFAGTHKYSSVQWFKDGVPVRGPRYIEKQGFLNISGVVPSDQGAYLCQVITKPFPPVYSRPAQLTVKGRRIVYTVSVEEMRRKWMLMSKYPRDVRNRLYRQTLVVPPSVDNQKLKFVPRPMNTNLELDAVRKVHCRAQGAAPPVIKWIKDGVEDDGFPEHVSDINGTLHFNKVQSTDKGTYTCIASNYQGVINATIEIDVVVSPKFTNLPSNPTEVFEGEPLLLDCMAEGDPKPAIHWDKNSNMEGFDKTRFKQLENGSLLIEDVQASDEGKYGCTAGNSGGLKRYEVSLIVRGTESYRVSDGNDINSTLGGSVLSKTVAVTLGAAGAYMVLVIGLMAYCRCRSRKNKSPPSDAQDPVLQAEAGHSGERKMCNGDAGGHSDGDLTAHSHQSQLSSRSYGKLPITRDHLTDMMVLGRGQFGDVCLARVEGAEEGAESVVMVKALQEIRDEAVLTDFKRELDLFGRLDHPNVVKLLGLCRQQQPHYMILQYTDWGDLKQMLMATKCDRKDKPKPPELPPKTMMHLVRGLCLGMEHISNHRLVHRDLAARNCLVSSDLSVKVSLSALSKDVYRKEYFLHRNKLLPIRWMPPEGVSEDDYSTKSDVFSFGVTVWEIFARGDLPHSGRSDQEVLSGLADSGGLSLDFPEDTPDQVVSLVSECRAPGPTDRPAFSSIALKVADIISKLE